MLGLGNALSCRRCQGLAFLVASGAVRDYPIELSAFLMERDKQLTCSSKLDVRWSQSLQLKHPKHVVVRDCGAVPVALWAFFRTSQSFKNCIGLCTLRNLAVLKWFDRRE
eukprot:2162113-Amphidinium_carterae.1